MKSHAACLVVGFLIGLLSNRFLWMLGRALSTGIIFIVIICVICLLVSSKKQSS